MQPVHGSMHGSRRQVVYWRVSTVGTDFMTVTVTGRVSCLYSGTWTVVSWEKDGKPAPDKSFKGMHMIFAKDTLTIMHGKKTLGNGTFKVAAGQKPHAIDYKEGKDITSVYDVGIFEIEGDTMKYCTTADAKKRPTKFDGKHGWLFVLKKEKK